MWNGEAKHKKKVDAKSRDGGGVSRKRDMFLVCLQLAHCRRVGCEDECPCFEGPRDQVQVQSCRRMITYYHRFTFGSAASVSAKFPIVVEVLSFSPSIVARCSGVKHVHTCLSLIVDLLLRLYVCFQELWHPSRRFTAVLHFETWSTGLVSQQHRRMLLSSLRSDWDRQSISNEHSHRG